MLLLLVLLFSLSFHAILFVFSLISLLLLIVLAVIITFITIVIFSSVLSLLLVVILIVTVTVIVILISILVPFFLVILLFGLLFLSLHHFLSLLLWLKMLADFTRSELITNSGSECGTFGGF